MVINNLDPLIGQPTIWSLVIVTYVPLLEQSLNACSALRSLEKLLEAMNHNIYRLGI